MLEDTNVNDREGFADLLGRNQVALMGYIYALVHNMDDAEDIYQQTSLILWNKREEFDPQSSFFHWAAQIARYEVFNFVRKAGTRKRYFSEAVMEMIAESRTAAVEQEMESRRQALTGCLGKLSDRDQSLVRECYADKRSVREVASSIDRPVKSVYDSLSRIRRALYECINRTLAKERGA